MFDLTRFAPLMYLAGRRLDELTMLDFRRVADTFGIKVDLTEELKLAGLALMQGQNINTVADMIQSPQSVAQLMNFLRGQGVNGDLATAEVDDMYSSTSVMYDTSAGEEPPAPPVRSEAPRQSRLIAPAAVGWRLPG